LILGRNWPATRRPDYRGDRGFHGQPEKTAKNEKAGSDPGLYIYSFLFNTLREFGIKRGFGANVA
jgi:hypothetical protein